MSKPSLRAILKTSPGYRPRIKDILAAGLGALFEERNEDGGLGQRARP